MRRTRRNPGSSPGSWCSTAIRLRSTYSCVLLTFCARVSQSACDYSQVWGRESRASHPSLETTHVQQAGRGAVGAHSVPAHDNGKKKSRQHNEKTSVEGSLPVVENPERPEPPVPRCVGGRVACRFPHPRRTSCSRRIRPSSKSNTSKDLLPESSTSRTTTRLPWAASCASTAWKRASDPA